METKDAIVLITLTCLVIGVPNYLYLKITTPYSPKSVAPLENGVRLAFFADVHITNTKEGAQVDLGGASYEIPKEAKNTLNKINPNVIFGLGDLTTHAEKEEWIGYKKWVKDLDAEVYDFLGNHDKDSLPGLGNYGTGYFTEVGRVSDTKVLKMGNNVFILISEEHDYEFDGDSLASTIPQKRFEFVEKYLKEYSESNNIFIMNHIPLSGTVAFSDTWFYGDNPNWIHITNKFFKLLENYQVDAHFSGHIHTDYRWRDEPDDPYDKVKGVEDIGKFVDGSKISSDRKYPPHSLPDTYFLNMPVVDFAHGWIGSRFYILDQLGNQLSSGGSKKKSQDSLSKLRMMWAKRFEDKGLPLFDFFHNPRSSYFLGRGAVYYFNMENGDNSVNIITRWTGGNRNVETYEMNLNNPINIGNKEMNFVASDLSLRKKENLIITLDNWFKIKAGKTGRGVFSKGFEDNVRIKGITIENYNLENYSAEWWESQDFGENWQKSKNLENMGEVNAVKIKINFKASNQKEAYIEDIDVLTKPISSSIENNS